MPDEIFHDLAEALDSLPNAFPKTESGVEIKLLKKIFTEDEATLACELNGDYQSLDLLAVYAKLTPREARKKLIGLVKKGLVWMKKENADLFFRLAPFVVGIFEAQLEVMDHEFSHLFEHYMLEAGQEIMKYDPGIHRAVPAVSLAKSEWVLPYDDVKTMIENAKAFSVRDCICRVQQGLIGKGCDAPRHNCLMLSVRERPAKPDDISKAEALAILNEADKVGLVHCVSNHQANISYICNCCGCCCGILRGINEWGMEKSVAHANYFAAIDPDLCANCGTCIIRCQVNAISEQNNVSNVEKMKCIGCGLCVTGCPEDAAQITRKPEDEIVHPPIDFTDWEQQRLRNRGMIN
ncbi:MAG: 4Fe-4S dicluster domain-containing protein [candidate division Zixibacteria bacterium]|nr:4Fe-4S dicluster domain-containing protein [candidate division Zixibacteria bacterium]